MLVDAELQGLDNQLGTYMQTSRQNYATQEKLLQDFQELIENYRQLKSDYEEEKESREKYKKLARGQERNPFALVLIDGDSYIFKDQHIKGGADGGVTAAQKLSNSIKELLQSTLYNDADQCRIMVRVYANLAGLSKTLSRAGLIGHESRSLAPFTASFNRSQDLFDFVDAGDKKDGADFKIREMFRLFADNSQCKHIFFAGCHDVGYLSMLTPYRGKSDRVTLLKAASFHQEFENLNLPIRELPSCFRSTPLNDALNSISLPTKGKLDMKTLPYTPKPKVCKFYPKGMCKYGSDCVNEHIDKSQRTLLRNFGKSSPSTDSDDTNSIGRFRLTELPSVVLPLKRPLAEGLIPINKDGDRLECICEKPSGDAWNTYKKRMSLHKVCNKRHLAGHCDDIDCKFDHSDLEPSSLAVLRFIMKQTPCPRGSACRQADCYAGHVCQKDGCRGGHECRFKPCKHIQYLDFKVTDWIEPDDSSTTEKSDLDIFSLHGDEGYEDSTPHSPVQEPLTEDILLRY
ncbi:hypothetical protein BGW36DRAFT_339586 [Talaromyces proteolyticus]|uniref:C3H1-type domain-containing protein n=1 Tax=Talaromyces proteolyticus TaxID=1131652 RepID=A0AAD4KU46_9EURO|nr:uncharacterized protein BGW36DRAFT_339586 [Talaromyces proteolyticus]KAH8698469.1 hypothetical protein BGW36DRAFT_339586 [Talaromyces proteolyticus]